MLASMGRSTAAVFGLGLILSVAGIQPCAAQGVSTFLLNLEIQTPDSPFLRFSQDTILGGPPDHVWELSGNEVDFSLNDVTGGSNVPFTVEAGTPTNTLYLSSFNNNGSVGVGTSIPESIGGRVTGGIYRHFTLNADIGEARNIVQGQTAAEWYIVHKGGPANRRILRTRCQNGRYFMDVVRDDLQGTTQQFPFCINMATLNVGIKTGSPVFPLQVGDIGGGENDGNGAHVTPGGVWTNASSRAVKNNIQPITTEAAREAVRALQPVGYCYKNEPDEKYIGFIAEDVPDLVATNDRRSLSPMDITAVLTRVVQDQDRQLDEQRQLIAQQRDMLTALSRRLTDLEQKSTGK